MTNNQLQISLAISAVAAAFFAYKWYDDRMDIKAFHDVLSKLPAGTTTIPLTAIPKDLLVKMDAMK